MTWSPDNDLEQFGIGAAVFLVLLVAGAFLMPANVAMVLAGGASAGTVFWLQRRNQRLTPLDRQWRQLPLWARDRTRPLLGMDATLRAELAALRDERRRTAAHLSAAELERFEERIGAVEAKRRAILAEVTALGATIRETSLLVEPRTLPSDLDRERLEEELADVQALRAALREVTKDGDPAVQMRGANSDRGYR